MEVEASLAVGQVVADDIISQTDLPPFPASIKVSEGRDLVLYSFETTGKW